MMNFDEAYNLHSAELLRYAESRCHDLQAAADIVAETYAKAWKYRANYDAAKGTVKTWLYCICKRVMIDHYRAQPVTLTLQDHDEPAAPAPSNADLEHAIDALPEDQGAAIRAVYYDGRTFPEAAELLGCAVGTVHNRCVAGLKQLRRILAA